MTFPVFLSASVPLPHRHARYFEDCDVVGVREAIRALVTALIPSGSLVFGGHPAITPLIRLLILDRGAAVASHIALFQSRFFEDTFPPEVREFENLKLVDAVRNDREASLLRMRLQMISSEAFVAGVFIGGMEGVENEFQLFREIHPNAPTFPIGSTGAAARLLYQQYGFDLPELMEDIKYLSLFRRLLNIPR